ncbi:MAG: hypothetical protein ACR2IF_04010 [Terriglobales bacterium]
MPSTSQWRSERGGGPRLGDVQVLVLLASAASIAALAYYYKWGQILLSGDAVAHINIARRVFDSRSPGPLQLGTVWLPLQHILTIPFIISDAAWSSGVGGAIISMVAYVLGTLGMYRLVTAGLSSAGASNGLARICSWFAAAVFAANPNILYLQATALNEPISLALIIWATAYFTGFAQLAMRGDAVLASARLKRCAWLLAADMLIRYDGWFAGAVYFAAAVVVFALARAKANAAYVAQGARATSHALLRGLATFALICAVAPAIWFAYNAFVWGNPLEFATGQYSARAIAERTRHAGDLHHPGWHSPYVAAEYFLRNAQLTMGESHREPRSAASWWERPWTVVALAGSALAVLFARATLPWLLLWFPLPFYAISIAWGDVPIFIPQWWPFSYYNTRYGVQLLPLFAASFGIVLYFALTMRPQRGWRVAVVLVCLAFVGGSYASVWRNVPICLREVRANGGARYALDGRLGSVLAELPPSGTLLIYLGDHGGALQRASIPLRRTINEGDYRVWERALEAPAENADFVIGASNDPVGKAAASHPDGLELLVVLQTPGQQPVRIYRSTK